MDLISGRPFWPAQDGRLHAYPSLDTHLRCDVAVIGGGITGALVAWHLAQAGIEVVVLDKRAVATGSTAASTALLQYDIDIPLVELAAMRGRYAASRAYRACARAVERLGEIAGSLGDAIQVERRGSLYLAKDGSDVPFLRREMEARRALGLAVTFLEAGAVRERFGIAREGALLSEVGSQVDAYAFAHALLRDAVSRGARVYEETRVAELDVSGTRCVLRTDGDVVVDARRVVIAAGYEAHSYLARPVAKLLSTYALVSGPGAVPSPWRDEPCLIWEHASPYLYLRTSADGRVFIGGEDEPFRDAGRRDALIGDKTARLVERFGELFPGETLGVAYAWAGTFGETEDGLAYVGGHPDWPHADFALGYGGNGITFGLLAAEIIRDGLLGRVHAEADLFRFGR